MAGNIFISYRRDLDAHFAGRLHDQLLRSFPANKLFIDVDDIEPGLDFVQVLEDMVAKCDVMLVIIGSGWQDAKNKDKDKDKDTGTRRLDNPDDFVRIEIASALRLDVRVIPVLVDGATMPDEQGLPEVLIPLARRHAVRITHDQFASDCGKLLKGINRALSVVEKRGAQAKEPAPTKKTGVKQAQQKTAVGAGGLILSALAATSSELRGAAAAAVLLALAAGGYYLGVIRPETLLQEAAFRYSGNGNYACFGDATFPSSWRTEATCLHFGCNFGQLDRRACLVLGARKDSKTVIHGNAGGGRSNECWLQQSCGDLRSHPDFTLFRR